MSINRLKAVVTCVFIVTAACHASVSNAYLRIQVRDTSQGDVPVQVGLTVNHLWHQCLARCALSVNGGITEFPTTYHGRFDWRKLAPEGSLRPGTRSAWVDVSEIMARRWNDKLPGLEMIFSFNTPQLPHDKTSLNGLGNLLGVSATIEFATAPDKDHVVKTIEVDTEQNRVVIVMPDASRTFASFAPELRTVCEDIQMNIDALRAAGVEDARTAKRITISTFGIQVGGVASSWLDRRATLKKAEYLRLLGFGYVRGLDITRYDMPGLLPFFGEEFGGASDWLKERPLATDYRTRLVEKYQPKLDQAEAAGYRKGEPYLFKVKDESKLFTLNELMALEGGLESFRDWLAKRGVVPSDVGKDSWKVVEPIGIEEATNDDAARLYYLTEWFRQEATRRIWKAHRDALHDLFGDGVIVNTCTPPNGFRCTPDYFVFSKGAAWDAIMPHYAPFLWVPIHHCMFQASVIHSSAEFGEAEAGALWARTHDARSAELTGVSGLIRGLRHFYLYDNLSTATPEATSKAVAVAQFFKSIARIEDVLLDGERPAAKVALLYSRAGEIWNPIPEIDEDLMFSGFQGLYTERQMAHTALAYNQVPVDILPEEEIINQLDRYSVLYITDTHVPEDVQEKIEAWVRGGGILFTQADAATRDELNRPRNLVEHLTDPTGRIERTNPVVPQRYTETAELYALPVLDKATCILPGRQPFEFEIVARKETLSIPNATILASYADGSPAAVVFTAGKGKVVRVGMSLGAALARSANPPFVQGRTERSTTRRFDPNIEQFYLYPVALAKLDLPVSAGYSGVDAGVFTMQDEAVILLADYADDTLRHIDLQLRVPWPYSSAHTLDGHPLNISTSDSSMTVHHVPLLNTQTIILKR